MANRAVIPIPVKNARLVRIKRGQMTFLTPVETLAVLNIAREHSTRDWAMILLAYRHRLRASEVCGLKLADVDGSHWCLLWWQIVVSRAGEAYDARVRDPIRNANLHYVAISSEEDVKMTTKPFPVFFSKGSFSSEHDRLAMLTKLTIIALMLTVTSTWIAFAQEPERVVEANRIRSVIADINKARSHSDAKAFAQLFTPDGDLQIGNKIIATGPSAIENALQRPDIWSEKTPPIIETESVRLLSSDVALVDAIQSQYGSVILKQSARVILLLKRSGNEWRIVSLRVLAINPAISTGIR